MPTITELKSQIRRDATAYDKLAKQYNALIKKERTAGHLKPSKNGRVTVADTTAGKNAGKRIVEAWNRVARKGQKLKVELEMYTRKVNAPRKPQHKNTGKKPGKTYRRRR